VNPLAVAGIAAASVAGSVVAGLVLFLAIFLPVATFRSRLLPDKGPKRLEGIASMRDAIEAGRSSGLAGLELAAWAQGVAARRFEYSRRNPWDSPERCFERGYGYCIQQARALKLLYDGLGIESRIVQAFRCSFPPKAIHGKPSPALVSGHAWLRARIGGRDYDICAGDIHNEPGRVHFRIISRVRPMSRFGLPFWNILSVAENARRDLFAAARGRDA
jgi:hypothetical protein